MQTVFRTAEEKDLPQVEELLLKVHGDRVDLAAGKIIVAFDGSKLVGCVRTKELGNGCRELASLGVLPEYRKQGIGRELVKKILEKDTARPVYLLCFSERENFYRLNNFEKADYEDLPQELQREYDRVSILLAAQDKEIIAMVKR